MIQMYKFTILFPKFKPNLLVRRALFLLNDACAMSILYLISCIYLASFVIVLPKIFEVVYMLPVAFDLS